MAVLSDVVGWLRQGYPQGVPDGDYIPLFALLGRHLTDEEVREIAEAHGWIKPGPKPNAR